MNDEIALCEEYLANAAVLTDPLNEILL
jgi:hypothetical protein